MSEVANIPQLRFPEFGDNWEEKKLGNVTSIVMGQSPDSTSYNSNGIGLYLIQGNADIKKRKTLPRVWTDTPTKECKVGDIIMTVRAPVGAVAKSIHNACIGRGVCAIRNNQHSVSNYIYQFLLSFEKKWVKFEQGSTFTAVNTKDVKSLKLILPPVQEQTKIAAFLTAVDNKIEQLSKKQELLGEYKKGLMQQIFSQAIRFKADDGSEFPDWEEKNGNEIFDNISNKNHDSDLPILAITQEHGAIPRDLINYKMIVSDKSVSSYKVVETGDFIISLRSFQGGIEYSNYKGICSPAYIILRPAIEIEKKFYKYYLKTYRYIQDLNRKLEGIRDGKMVSYKYFSEIKLPYPSISEQAKIANFLSSIDNKIEQVGKQLDESKQFKKALLQQMFV